MRYLLLLILFNGTTIKTESLPFASEKACQKASEKILKEALNRQDPHLKVKALCLDRGLEIR